MFNNYNLDSYHKTVVSTHVNAVTGNITKTYKDSFFKRFHLTSKLADKLFANNSEHRKIKVPERFHDEKYSDPEREVVVVQMVICGDMEVIAELIYKEDYEKIFNGEEQWKMYI